MKNKQGTFLLGLILAAAAPAFADNIPGQSRDGSKYVTLSDVFAGQQNAQGNSAQCNFVSGSTKENGLSTISLAGAFSSGFAKGENDSEFGGGNSVKLVDFGGNEGASSDKDKGKNRGKQDGGDGEGNGTGSGSGDASPAVSVAEPASQTLLLFGLAGLGMLFCRRKMLSNPI